MYRAKRKTPVDEARESGQSWVRDVYVTGADPLQNSAAWQRRSSFHRSRQGITVPIAEVRGQNAWQWLMQRALVDRRQFDSAHVRCRLLVTKDRVEDGIDAELPGQETCQFHSGDESRRDVSQAGFIACGQVHDGIGQVVGHDGRA